MLRPPPHGSGLFVSVRQKRLHPHFTAAAAEAWLNFYDTYAILVGDENDHKNSVVAALDDI